MKMILSPRLMSPSTPLTSSPTSQSLKRSTLYSVQMIVLHGLPFSLVEYPKSFVATLNPWFKLSRTTIKSDCIRMYEEAKQTLRNTIKKLKSRVSLTADLWTSNQTLGYLCVTCHYIDDSWKLHKNIIRFTLVETPHDGWNLFNAMLKTLQDWDIEDKLFAITLDNASSFVETLEGNLVAKASRHTLRETPPLDAVTRWNSAYQMLKIALEYRSVFESLRQVDSQYTHLPSNAVENGKETVYYVTTIL
ncbi:hypothetical protein U9M48_033226 [Paspalum notatum var. saurae]|uniref:Uncharacterized protein n=1 Tax=Paspalum notatum var. saurae TaxID=547442 RepID=A0AAQ3U927_PASNO